MWSGETRPECFRYRVLGLPWGKLDAVSRIRRSAALFLYDFHAKYLYGPYRAKTVRALLAGLGEDDRREGLRRTPKRVAKAFRDGTRGDHFCCRHRCAGWRCCCCIWRSCSCRPKGQPSSDTTP
ncbi:uncharacterized protein [Triticum aestivum]|uniref:uncharacterized protein n=1 Tax=Triticum aestivum TaxID=4565 RepID=UPI00098AC08B|nr:uncharacterized protein LOC123119406 [Triticum aestivum]